VGALTETLTVEAEAPVIQASSGERSFSVDTEAVTNLPLANRNFATLASSRPASAAPAAWVTGRPPAAATATS
jgi:hypothetical protein